MHTMKSDEVCYKMSTEDFEKGYTSEIINANPENDNEQPELTGGAMLAMAREEDDLFSKDNIAADNDKFVTGSEIECGSKYEINPPVLKIPKYFCNEDEIIGGKLCLGYNFENLRIGNYHYSGTIKKRYCPNCHKLLLKEAGQMPIINVGMLGHSKAGKTVFLIMQYYSINRSRFNFTVHNGRLFIEPVFTSKEHRSDDVIYSKEKEFERSGEIPPTTQMNSPPHCLKVSYRRKKDGDGFENENTTHCILCFKDIVGELMTADTVNSEILNMCRKADAFFFMNDPYSLNYTRNRLPEHVLDVDPDDDQRLIDMRNQINDIFDHIGEAVQTPVVCILTKIDDLLFYSNTLEIDVSEPALATNLQSEYFIGDKNRNWAENVYNPICRSAKKILKHLDEGGSWMDVMENHFTNAVYVPVSSIGSEVRIIEVERTGGGEFKRIVTKSDSDEYNSFRNTHSKEEVKRYTEELCRRRTPYDRINPRFIELPIFTVLMKFNIIPPMNISLHNENPQGFMRIFSKKNTNNNFEVWHESCAMINNCAAEPSFSNGKAPEYSLNRR